MWGKTTWYPEAWNVPEFFQFSVMSWNFVNVVECRGFFIFAHYPGNVMEFYYAQHTKSLNHGGYTINFSHFGLWYFKIFSNHGGYTINFSHFSLWYFKLFSNHGGYTMNFIHFALRYFKIYSDHGGDVLECSGIWILKRCGHHEEI